MKLITFQSMEALKSLINKGYLECDESKIDNLKVGETYKWIVEEMNKRIPNKYNTKYPLWCWVSCYNSIAPPKRKGKKVEGFDVKITFNIDEKDIFITDFRRYSFLLNNMYIPKNKKDKDEFDKLLEKYNITKEELLSVVRKDRNIKMRSDKDFLSVCEIINKSFNQCITKDSNILQGCIWRINLDDVEKIEILKDNNYIQGSLNYIRSDGKRFDWIKDYYKRLN